VRKLFLRHGLSNLLGFHVENKLDDSDLHVARHARLLTALTVPIGWRLLFGASSRLMPYPVKAFQDVCTGLGF